MKYRYRIVVLRMLFSISQLVALVMQVLFKYLVSKGFVDKQEMQSMIKICAKMDEDMDSANSLIREFKDLSR